MSMHAARPESAAAIDTEAAAWAAHSDRGTLSPAENEQLEKWLAADPRRLGAFARARAISAHFDRARALGPQFVSNMKKARQAQSNSGSRSLPRWPIALAACAALVAVGVGALLVLKTGQYSTSLGEVRLFSLPDGSRVALNTATAVAVDYSKSRRRIDLIRGEALFDVAKDTNRPFIVEIDEAQVRAIGTSFTVRRMPGKAVQVLVREGVVEMTGTHQGSPSAPVRLPANTRAYASLHQPVEVAPLAATEVARELAWQEGMISLGGMTLREAAEEFARYSDVRIVIDDPKLAERTVTGRFAANNPQGFAQAIALSMDLGMKTEGKVVRLLPSSSLQSR